MALPTVEVETPSPKCSSKTWRCSSRVRSSLASRCLGSHSLSIAPFLEGLPGIGPGSTSPVSRRLFIQRFMVGIDTEKVLATSSLGVPASTAASTLNLRSFEYGFMPGGYHIWIDTYGCRCEIPLPRAARLFSCLSRRLWAVLSVEMVRSVYCVWPIPCEYGSIGAQSGVI